MRRKCRWGWSHWNHFYSTSCSLKKFGKFRKKNIIIIKRNIIRSEKKKKRKWNKKLRRRKNRKEQFFLSTTCNTSTWKNSLKRAWDLSSFSTFYDYYQSDGSTFQYVFISLANRKSAEYAKKKHSVFSYYTLFFVTPPVPPFSLSSMYDQSCPPEKKRLQKKNH